MKEFKHYSNYFCGNKVSDYGIKHGYVDYRTLAKAFDAVLNNDIIEKTNYVLGYWEQESGFIDNSEEIEEFREQIEELEEKVDDAECDMEDIAEVKEDYENSNIYIALRDKVDELREQIEELEEKINELEEEQEGTEEIFQYFIVDDNGARILKDYNEIVFYNEELDMYVWGVTHWGTSWDYVLTNIKIVDEEYN